MPFTLPRTSDARAIVSVAGFLLLACGASSTKSAPPGVVARDDEKWFASVDGWEFLAPKDFTRNTSPGTTGFAVSHRAPSTWKAALVLTTEGFGGDVSAFVANERAKLEIVKEQPDGSGVVLEERWKTGPDDYGKAMVRLMVQNGVGIRLACIVDDKHFEAQRAICQRAIDSLRRPHQTP